MKKEIISDFDDENAIYLHCGCGCGILYITQYIDNIATPTGEKKDVYYDFTYYSHFKKKNKKFDWSLSLSQEQMIQLAKALTDMTKIKEKL